MPAERYVVLGLASVRAPWFRDVGRWATAAAIPVDFVKCVSPEEMRARLAGGRSFSAVLVDGGLPGVDRDLLELAIDAGSAVIVVDDGHSQRDWTAIGATSVLPADFHRGELMDELAAHGRAIDRSELAPVTIDPDAPSPDWMGRLVAVTGGSGAGTSTMAMAIAQGLGDDPRYADLTLLADCALYADHAMLHDAQDVLPGLQEMVDAHRTGSPSLREIRSLVFEATERRYHLLLGLRRHRDWSVLRPRAVDATVDSLLRSYRVVVADIDPDVEGEDEVGSVDVEERNVLSRTIARRADLIVVVGTPTMKGLHDLLRIIDDLVGYGVAAGRLVPVLNRSTRQGRQRAEMSAAFGELVTPISTALPSPVHVPERRTVEDIVRDNARLPTQLTKPITAAVLAALDRAEPVDRADASGQPVTPGSLGHFLDDGFGDPGLGSGEGAA